MARVETASASAPATVPAAVAGAGDEPLPSLTVERDALLDAVDRAAAATGSGKTIPILSYLLLTAGPGGLTVTGTDLDRWRTVRREAGAVETPGRAVVPAQALRAALQAHPAGSQVRIDRAPGNAAERLRLRSPRCQQRLPTLPPADFPPVPEVETGVTITVDGATLRSALAATGTAESREQTRYYLCGTFFEVLGPSRLRLVATDGHRLALVEIDAETTPAPDDAARPTAVVPSGTTALLRGWLLEGPATVALDLDGTRVVVEQDSERLVSRLIDGTFPEYPRVIPVDPPRLVTVRASLLADALKRMLRLLDKQAGGRLIGLAARETLLGLRGTAGEHGEGTVGLDLPAPAAMPHVCGFNARYLADAIEVLEAGGADLVELRGDGPSSPHVLTAEGAGGVGAAERLVVVMPARPDVPADVDAFLAPLEETA